VANVIILTITGPWLSRDSAARYVREIDRDLRVRVGFFCGNGAPLIALVYLAINPGMGARPGSPPRSDRYEVFPREEFGTARGDFGVGVMVGSDPGADDSAVPSPMLRRPWIFYSTIPLACWRSRLIARLQPDIRGSRRSRSAWITIWFLLLAAGVGTLHVMLESR